MPPDPLMQYLQRAGFKGQGLKTAWAIAKRESGGRPEAYNPDRSTGDNSYGLFQINMLGDMGPSRRKQFGIQSNEQLLDPNINAKAAYQMSKGGTDFGAWGIGPNAYRKMPALDFTGYPGPSPEAKAMSSQAAQNITIQSSTPVSARDVGNYAGAVGMLAENQDHITQVSRLNKLLAQATPSAGTQSILERLGGTAAGVVSRAAKSPLQLRVPRPIYDNKVSAPAAGETELAPVGAVVEGNSIGARAVKQAATQLGKPYVFGSGPSTESFDCSDLVQWSYKQLGIDIPRDTVGQQAVLPLKSWNNLKPGDAIYRKSGGHVVIYAGNNKVIAAPHTGTVVQYQSLDNFPQDKWEVRAITGKGK